MGLVQLEDGKVLYYPYTPSTAAGYAFMACFAVVTCVHIVRVVQTKRRFFFPMILGGEIFGYYGRAWGGQLPNSPKPFMLQLMLILIAPVFVCATIYVTLGRLKQRVLGRPNRKCSITVLFILTDIVAFCSQIGGGLVQVTGSLKLMKIGDHIVLAGLVFQLVVLAIYLGLVYEFWSKAKRQHDTNGLRWQPFVAALAGTVVAVWIRNLVRAIEFMQGFHGFISENEAMLYIFDAFLMLLVMVTFIPFYNSNSIVPQPVKGGWDAIELGP
ncbi:hypothetical protein FOPG_09688 [Fusarium oxysporum f. sp. conglutinans race 2 54008]|uniref:Uncharacterized protein n=1 Tax=Fusarium oxysporum f. sp. conglutinans race 2 54008 TaxID=1089457 RepID=X0IQQ3_FUSOX|nr:hypothetical protein FOPG_09688 [Fusarium oxysporum f. sp. conglutinans race 2 54008]KAG7003068.1 Protoporphyrin uptake protein 1 [Fusarium oxysporum f. sp. conglutinans]KAI8400206.1 hypothetical protein FOFC_19033 [Fusarium oxysporum]